MRPGAARAVVLGLVLLSVAAASQFRPSGYTTIALAREDGTTILRVIAKDGERVTLTWRNSLFGLLVTEVFTAQSGFLVQDQVTFAPADGSVPPRVPAAAVDDLYHTGGAFDASGLARPFAQIVYRIGEVGDPKLEIKGRTIALQQEAGFGGRLVLAAGRPALYELAFAR